ncbi:MAG: type II secretion system secretin GspD [Deltaproteobacteria bacterium]|nr:type II secretion system secretin GspD [Deltaproteobacteria bacterium]
MRRTRRLSPALTALLVVAGALGGGAPRALGPDAARAQGAPRTQPDTAPTPVEAQGPRVVEADGERDITMDFQDVDLGVLVKFMGEITGKNFVMDERVQGKVTVVSPTKITPEEAYQVFQAVLQVKGFTTVPSGAVVRIIPTKDAKETSLQTLTDGGGHIPTEEYVTRLIPLTQVDAADIGNVLQPLVSKDGLITSYPQTNSLIIIDSAANVARLTRMIAELDVASSRRHTELIPLKHAVASELTDTIQQVLEEKPAAPGQPPAQGQRTMASGQIRAFKITPDDRTNTLIVNAAVDQMGQIKALVARLDVPLPPGSGKINVYYLKFANAEDLLPVLLDVIGASGGGTSRPARPQQQPPGQTGAGRNRRTSSGSSLRRSSADRTRRPPNQAGQQGGQTGQQPAIEFASDVRITADPATNSLIVTAAPEDYAILLGVIEKLDIRRRQVYVEAIILEVTLDRLRQLGIEVQGGIGLPNGTGLSRVNLGNLNTALADPGSLSGLILAAVSERTVKLPDGRTVPAQAALLTALQNESDVNILSAPNILTTDNEEAEIIVGQNVPFVASRSTSETNLSNTFSTIEREDVGITLRLTPQISEGAIVRMALFEEVSALVPNSLLDANAVGPTTTVRSASTTITVKDSQTVVIGGLISDSITATESKVPFLGDVPVIGNFFKKTNSQKNKINLLIFLTPHIIKNEADAATVSTTERDRFRSMMERSGTPQRIPDPLDRPSFELHDRAAPDSVEPEPTGDRVSGATSDRAAGGPRRDAAAEGGPLLTLTDVQVDRRNQGAVIRVAISGTPTRVEHYALSDPGRYVIDVYGASVHQGQVESVPVIDPLVRRVRVAHHRGRMRLVLDLKTAQPPAYVLERRDGTIALELGDARTTDASAPSER